MAATVQHEQLYGTWQHRTLAYTMAATVQHEQLYGMRQHLTLWHTQWQQLYNMGNCTHMATQNTGIHNGINCTT